MNSDLDIKDLQRAAQEVMLLMRLRTAAVWSVVFGLISVWIGLSHRYSILPLCNLGLASILILGAALSIAIPNRKMLLAGFVTISIAGFWNISSYWMIHDIYLTLFLGIVQLKLGFDRYNDYKRLSANRMGEPTSEALDFMYNAVKRAISGKPDESERLVQLRAKGIIWRMLLSHKVAVLVSRGGAALIVRGRDDLDLLRGTSNMKTRLVAITGDVIGNVPASMSEQHFEVYRNWRRSAGKRKPR